MSGSFLMGFAGVGLGRERETVKNTYIYIYIYIYLNKATKEIKVGMLGIL